MRRIILLSVLTIVFIGAGLYFNTEPEWTKKTFPDHYNKGVSDYLEGRGEEAYGQFGHVASLSDDPKLKSLAFYNAGTMLGEVVADRSLPAYLRFQVAQFAIESLEEALRNNPNDEEAKYNLEFIRNILPKLLIKIQQEEEDGAGKPQPGPGYSPGEEDKGY